MSKVFRNWLVPLVSILMLIVISVLFWQFTVDDSYISFRYAQNLADGFGIVFNPGERVEGYSNFLWILILSLFAGMGFDLVVTAKVLGVLFSAATLLVLWKAGLWLNKGQVDRITHIAPILCASNAAYGAWGIGGLEPPLFSFLITCSVLRLLQERTNGSRFPWSGLLLGLTAIARPEGILFTFLWMAVVAGSQIRNPRNLRPSLYGSLRLFFSLSLFGVYLAWRFWYYGHWLPNTFYAKTGGGLNQIRDGLVYAGSFFLNNGIIFLPLLVLAALRSYDRDRTEPLWLIFFLVIGYMGFVVIAGGDWMPLYRLFVPILPLFFLLVQEAVRLVLDIAPSYPWVRTGLVLTLIAVVPLTLFQAARFQKYLLLEQVNFECSVIDWLEENAPPKASIALQLAGAIPFYTRLYTIDRMGLLDPHISRLPGGLHHKQDEQYILNRKPTFIQIFAKNDPRKFAYDSIFVGDRVLWSMPEFHRDYRMVFLCGNEKAPNPNRYLLLFQRRQLEPANS